MLKAREIAATGVDGVIAGHGGLPFTQVIGGSLWHNAGIIGFPANDGTPRVWYSVLQPTPDGVRIEHRALEYDYRLAAAAMARANLPDGYRLTLASGRWPSSDVLPAREIAAGGIALQPGERVWRPLAAIATAPASPGRKRPRTEPDMRQLWPIELAGSGLAAGKFMDPRVTAAGEPRASVALVALNTLWFNTGTQCNITCRNCYIDSSPSNDRLVYLTLRDVQPFLDEIERDRLPTSEIGFTGGEPFINPHILELIDACLAKGHRVVVLTNAMRPMQRYKHRLLDINARAAGRLTLRVSLDHFTAERHEEERGVGTFAPTMAGLAWLSANGFQIAVAGRTMWGEDAAGERAGYGRLFAQHHLGVDAADTSQLILFPEMDATLDVPEITTACWGILGKHPSDVMCATSRMVVRRKTAERAAVLSCTLLPYEPAFELGSTLRDAAGPVSLNHAHCARFCVLGGASCSVASAKRD